MVIELIKEHSLIKIFINDILHLAIVDGTIVGIQTWLPKEGEIFYCIEFTLIAGGSILCEYDNITTWKDVIELINNKIL